MGDGWIPAFAGMTLKMVASRSIFYKYVLRIKKQPRGPRSGECNPGHNRGVGRDQLIDL